MLVFTPQPAYYYLSSPRDQYLQSLAEDATRERYLNKLSGNNYSYRSPQYHSYANVQDALVHEYYRQREVARREELNHRMALERHRQQQLERQRQQRRYLAELERRRYLDAVRHAQREYSWPFDSCESDGTCEDQKMPSLSPAPSPGKPPMPEATLEQKHSAAATIQSAYRSHLARHRALTTLSIIRNAFNSLTTSFTFPSKPSFDSNPGSPSYKLSYNSINAPIHAHEDALVNLLSKLDSVESNGDAIVRSERKKLASDIEAELGRLDQRKEEAWEVQRVEMDLQAHPTPSEAEMDQVQVSSDMDVEMAAEGVPATSEGALESSEVSELRDSENLHGDSLSASSADVINQQPVRSTSDLMEVASPQTSSIAPPLDSDSDVDEPSLASLFQLHEEPEEPNAPTEEEFILV